MQRQRRKQRTGSNSARSSLWALDLVIDERTMENRCKYRSSSKIMPWLDSRGVSGQQGQRRLIAVAWCSSGGTGIETVRRQQGRINNALAL
ncbi:hypothetical protein NL676_015823 [Syzygium grande]|nr:hypothetical protein NL676_015823 [Syzygium grande]